MLTMRCIVFPILILGLCGVTEVLSHKKGRRFYRPPPAYQPVQQQYSPPTGYYAPPQPYTVPIPPRPIPIHPIQPLVQRPLVMYGLPPQKLPGHGTSGNAYPQQTYAQPIPVSKQVAQRPAAYPSPVQQAKPYPKPYPAQVQQPAKVQYPKPSSPAPASYPSAPVASPAPYPKPSYQSSPSYGNLPAPAPIPAPQSAPIYVAPAVSTAYSAAAAPIPSPDSAPVYIPPAISTVYAAAYEGASGNYPASYPAETLTASSKPTTSSAHSPAPASSSYSTATTSSSYSTAVSSSAYSTSAASPAYPTPAVQQQDTYKASPEVPTSYSEPNSYPAQKETILDLPTPVYTPLSLKQEATVSETAERQYYPTTTSPAVEVQQSASYPAEASESYSKPETHDEDSKQYNEESKPEQSSSYAAPSAGPRPCDEDAKKDDSSEHSQPSYETHSQDSGSVKAAQEPSNYPETKSYPSSANSVAAPAAPALPVTNAKSNSRPKPTLKPYKATTTSTTTAAPSYPSEAVSTTRKPYKAKVPTKAIKKPQGPTPTSPNKYSETSTYAPASTTTKKIEIKPAYKRPSTSKPVTQVAVSESVGSRYPAEYDNSKVAVDSVPTVKAPSGYSSTAAPVNVATPTRKSSQPTYYSQENSAAKFESYAAPAAVAVSTTQPNYAVSGQSNKPESNGYQTPINSSPAQSNQYSKPDYSQQQGIPSDMIDSYSQQPVSSMESGDYQSQRPVAESNPSVAGQEYDDSDDSETEDQSVTMSMSAIPGEPGTDYPIFSELPDSTFNCSEQNLPGYYADVSARCQVFHICLDDRQWSFLCPNGTIFSQEHFVCVWWNEFDCSQATSLYSLNERLYKENPVSQESPKESYDQSENLASSTTYSKGMDYGSSKSYA